MDTVTSRRSLLKGGLAAAGLAAFGIPEWAMPALAAGETLVPFAKAYTGLTDAEIRAADPGRPALAPAIDRNAWDEYRPALDAIDRYSLENGRPVTLHLLRSAMQGAMPFQERGS